MQPESAHSEAPCFRGRLERINWRRHRTLFRTLLAVWLVCVVWGTLLPAGKLSTLENVLPFLEWSDKIKHFGAYAGLSLLCMVSFDRGHRIALALSMILLGLVSEAGQNFSRGRTPDLEDALANSIGVFAGMGAGFLITQPSVANYG